MISRERGLFSIKISQKYHTHESSELAPDAALPPFRAENYGVTVKQILYPIIRATPGPQGGNAGAHASAIKHTHCALSLSGSAPKSADAALIVGEHERRHHGVAKGAVLLLVVHSLKQ